MFLLGVTPVIGFMPSIALCFSHSIHLTAAFNFSSGQINSSPYSIFLFYIWNLKAHCLMTIRLRLGLSLNRFLSALDFSIYEEGCC